jgi:uncharacterized tellurite resistance protein B-like protein
MSRHQRSSSQEASPTDLASGIRGTLDQLDDLDRETAGYLNSLALVLQRVAAADEHISREEVDRMEKILVDHTSLSPPQAVLTVEIAKHRRQLADCCCAYRSNRELRSRLDTESRRRLRQFLEKVAEADGLVQPSEEAEIRQIAAELGITAADPPASRP